MKRSDYLFDKCIETLHKYLSPLIKNSYKEIPFSVLYGLIKLGKEIDLE